MQEIIQERLVNQDLASMVEKACQRIAPVWPLETFIACNPFHGFEDEKFELVMDEHFQTHIPHSVMKELEQINREMIKWCGAFLDMGQGTIELPHRNKGFYHNFCYLSIYDSNLHQGKNSLKKWLSQLPTDPLTTIEMCLEKLNISSKDYPLFISQSLGFLPGWAGYIKWLSDWCNDEQLKNKFSINLTQFLAVRLVITCLFWPQAHLIKKTDRNSNQINSTLASMQALEKDYTKNFYEKIKKELVHPIQSKNPSLAQMVFCIDVRSEPFRRQIEAVGNYETLGFAGFFGLAIRVHEINQPKSKDCCPVLLKPRFELKTEFVANPKQRRKYQKGYEFLQSFMGAYHQLKYNFITPFNLADAMGPWSGISMFLKNFMPKSWQKILSFSKEIIRPDLPTDIIADEHGCMGISHQEQVNHAKLILELMGLKQFAKIVVFCGHTSTSNNNPYASSLNCGACGGNHGEYNAKLLANILNRSEVRKDLADMGIIIPESTRFIGALHNTTTDDCDLLYSSSDPHNDLILQLKADLKKAQLANNLFRLEQFSNPDVSVTNRSHYWAETRPEWGLARNSAFLVAPRRLSENIDLDGRCFLHSYNWEIDEDGKLLTIILTAPMVVAQWINCQYLFSTLDNIHFGSGSKITHNVVGKLGIMQGNSSDLMHGLPLQSVSQNDEHHFHQPQRLACWVLAPRERVMSIIHHNPILVKLFGNHWVNLMVIDPRDNLVYQFTGLDNWKLYEG
jgi:hypothetical protein